MIITKQGVVYHTTDHFRLGFSSKFFFGDFKVSSPVNVLCGRMTFLGYITYSFIFFLPTQSFFFTALVIQNDSHKLRLLFDIHHSWDILFLLDRYIISVRYTVLDVILLLCPMYILDLFCIQL